MQLPIASLFCLTLVISANGEPFWKWFCQYTYNGIEQYKRSVGNQTGNETAISLSTTTTSVPVTTVTKIYYRNTVNVTTTSAIPTSTQTVTQPLTEPIAKDKEQCAQYDDSQLYGMLTSVRAFNQRFMANTVREAAKFPELHVASDAAVVGSAHHVTKMKSLSDCDDNCQSVEKQLNAALEEYRHSTRDSPNSIGTGKRVKIINPVGDDPSVKQSCKLEAFFAVGDCSRRGEEVESGFARLCTACNGVYKVSAGCFPQFFNAVTCDSNDTTCIYDWWRLNAHGKCQEQKLTFTVMKNLGTPTCQRWEYENLQVPIGCECFLNKSSFLRT